MKRPLVASGFIALMLIGVVSLRLLAQDRSALKSANGIAFSEFNGYDTWQVISVSHPDSGGGCGSTKEDCIKRFTQTNGWGYAMFLHDAATDKFRTDTNDPTVMRTLCHSCHTSGAKARDYVYTNYAKR